MKYFDSDLPSVGEIAKQTSLAFVNTNPVIDYIAPLSANVIPLGGLHIKELKPIPKVIFSCHESRPMTKSIINMFWVCFGYV